MQALTERVAAATSTEPLSALAPAQRAELDRLLARAVELEDLPGKWQAALLEAELRATGAEPSHGGGHCCHGH